MNTKYSEEFKASIIAKLLPPNNARISDVAKETGIPKDTLYTWRSKYRHVQGSTVSGPGQQCGVLRSEEKFAILLETASLNELEIGEYCRRKGLYPEQIAGWKKTFIQGSSPEASKSERALLQQQAKTIKQLQSELHRKDRALAEAAALLVLGKKAQALWGETEDEKSTSQSAKK
jgi:transposase-like protein